MLAPHPAGSAVHRGYSWPGLEKVSNLMGDEENAKEIQRLEREVGEVKVFVYFALLVCLFVFFFFPPVLFILKTSPLLEFSLLSRSIFPSPPPFFLFLK